MSVESMHRTWPKADPPSLEKSTSSQLSPRRVKKVAVGPLAQRSTSRANPNALEESTWLVRACQLKSVKGGEIWGGSGASNHIPVGKLTRGLPSMAVIRAATCPFHHLHPSQHNEDRAELVRWCISGDKAGTGVILYPEVMPKKLRGPLARQEAEMRRCPFCQQCIARCEVLKQDEEEARAAQRLKRRREKQLNEIKKTMGAQPVNGMHLDVAVRSWEFEPTEEVFVAASSILAEYYEAVSKLESLMHEQPIRLGELYAAVGAWQFALDTEACPALSEARRLLSQYEGAVRSAVSAADGWQLNKLWAGLNDALGVEGQELAVEATALHGRHSATVMELHRLMGSAPQLEAAPRNDIARLCQDWAFAEDDPTLQLGRAWLRSHEDAARRCAKELSFGERHRLC